MNRSDLGEKVAEVLGISKIKGGLAVTTVFDAIEKALSKQETVSLVGFGTFRGLKSNGTKTYAKPGLDIMRAALSF